MWRRRNKLVCVSNTIIQFRVRLHLLGARVIYYYIDTFSFLTSKAQFSGVLTWENIKSSALECSCKSAGGSAPSHNTLVYQLHDFSSSPLVQFFHALLYKPLTSSTIELHLYTCKCLKTSVQYFTKHRNAIRNEYNVITRGSCPSPICLFVYAVHRQRPIYMYTIVYM